MKENNDCYNCKHKKKSQECKLCLVGYKYETPSQWQPKEIESEKNCDTCKHCLPFYDGCNRCDDFNNWEEIEKPADCKDANKTKIILISGKARHGKDSAANIMKKKLENQGNKVLTAHYGDLVKYTCKTFFDWNGEKDEKGRTLLQEVGTDKVRTKYPNFWVNFIRGILSIFETEWDYVLIPDTRFPNEIELMKNSFDDVTDVCVIRTNFISPLSDEQRNHKSEIALDEHIFDYYLIAEDLETLERKVDNFLKTLEESECK